MRLEDLEEINRLNERLIALRGFQKDVSNSHPDQPVRITLHAEQSKTGSGMIPPTISTLDIRERAAQVCDVLVNDILSQLTRLGVTVE